MKVRWVWHSPPPPPVDWTRQIPLHWGEEKTIFRPYCSCNLNHWWNLLFFFQGEQHGFRKAENIKFSIDGEFYFYSKVFNLNAPGIQVDVSSFNIFITWMIIYGDVLH